MNYIKIKSLVFAVIISGIYQSATAQKAIDLTAGFAEKQTLVSLAFNKQHGLGSKKKFTIGYGIRFNNSAGTNVKFITAPASVTEGNFFKAPNMAKLDTLTASKHSINSLNTVIYLGYNLNKKLAIGFNIDVFGLSFGKVEAGQFMAASERASKTSVTSKVTAGNILLTGDYDRGSLNSELTITYKASPKIKIKAGAGFMFSEVTTDTKLAFDNDRFRNKALMPALGVSYSL